MPDLYAHPRHPYTVALLSAVPVPDPDLAETRSRAVLTGDPPLRWSRQRMPLPSAPAGATLCRSGHCWSAPGDPPGQWAAFRPPVADRSRWRPAREGARARAFEVVDLGAGCPPAAPDPAAIVSTVTVALVVLMRRRRR